MQKFKFSLATLLRVRQMEEEQAQVKLADARRQLVREKVVLNAIEAKLAESLAEFRNIAQQQPTIASLKLLQTYDHKLREDLRRQQFKVKAAVNYCQECIELLQNAVKQRQLVEKLREKKLTEYKLMFNREEQLALDEIGIQLYTRKA